MRMWMIDPEIMCRQHLLGEHVEIHMFIGCINKGMNLKGYLEKGLIEPISIFERHEELVKEMENRGYKHNSPLPEVDLELFTDWKIDEHESFKELIDRCPECYEKWSCVYD